MIPGMRIRIFLTILLVSYSATLPAMTAGYKCVGTNGHVTYQSIPCAISDIEAPIDAIINSYPGTGADFEYDTTVQTSKSTRSQTPPTQDASACRVAEETLQRFAREKYNNAPGSLRQKLIDRANAIRQKMKHCP
jgi:hypothetical protein